MATLIVSPDPLLVESTREMIHRFHQEEDIYSFPTLDEARLRYPKTGARPRVMIFDFDGYSLSESFWKRFESPAWESLERWALENHCLILGLSSRSALERVFTSLVSKTFRLSLENTLKADVILTKPFGREHLRLALRAAQRQHSRKHAAILAYRSLRSAEFITGGLKEKKSFWRSFISYDDLNKFAEALTFLSSKVGAVIVPSDGLSPKEIRQMRKLQQRLSTKNLLWLEERPGLPGPATTRVLRAGLAFEAATSIEGGRLLLQAMEKRILFQNEVGPLTRRVKSLMNERDWKEALKLTSKLSRLSRHSIEALLLQGEIFRRQANCRTSSQAMNQTRNQSGPLSAADAATLREKSEECFKEAAHATPFFEKSRAKLDLFKNTFGETNSESL